LSLSWPRRGRGGGGSGSARCDRERDGRGDPEERILGSREWDRGGDGVLWEPLQDDGGVELNSTLRICREGPWPLAGRGGVSVSVPLSEKRRARSRLSLEVFKTQRVEVRWHFTRRELRRGGRSWSGPLRGGRARARGGRGELGGRWGKRRWRLLQDLHFFVLFPWGGGDRFRRWPGPVLNLLWEPREDPRDWPHLLHHLPDCGRSIERVRERRRRRRGHREEKMSVERVSS
jgi:hypothetical protein